MATLQQRIENLATRMASECKSLRTLMNANASDLSSLNTTNKTNLVSAVNELKSLIDSIQTNGVSIDDALTASASKTWSINKINSAINSVLNGLLAGAPAALDTLDELAAAIGDEANFAATITAALGNRVRVDTATQSLSTEQKANARANIDAYGVTELGDPDTNFVTTFTTGLL